MQLPPAFIKSIKNVPGLSVDTFENIHQSGQQITSVRVNPLKISPERLPVIDAAATEIPWSRHGYYLSQRPSFTGDPLFHAGAYYVQEASSMFLEMALQQTVDVNASIKVLDLCAAPGGKSTLIQSVINKESLLVSNEVIKTRVNILTENITKWGAANVIVTNNDAKDFQRLPGYFDAIVVDAPCSGSGLFRKDPHAVSEWSEQNVHLCSQRQQRILADVWPALKENGVLIYSTCSYSMEEDEAIADWLLSAFNATSLALQTEPGWGIVETASPEHKAYGYRFYPDKIKGEGFFIAAFKKRSGSDETKKTGKGKNRSEQLTAKEIDIVKPYLQQSNEFFFIKQNEAAVAVPAHLENDLAAVQSALYIKKAGVKLGAIIRNELVPDHELAVSTVIDRNLPTVDLNEANALQYLRRQDVKIETGIKGWALISYRQLPLGWAKILLNRINNYYPKDWRILNK